jgi:hypothetical protein
MLHSISDIPAKENRVQLRLHHLFVLTAVMALLLAIQGPQRNFADSEIAAAPLHVAPAAWGMWGLAYQVLAAAAITALGYGIDAYRRGRSFFNEPGHWILVEVVVTTLLAIPNTLLFRSLDFPGVRMGSWSMTFMVFVGLYSMLSLILGRMVLNIFLARKCSERRWKRVFYAKAFAAVFWVYAELFVVAFALITARWDRREQVHRDDNHWCGVVVQLALSALTIVSVVVLVLLR